MKKIVVGRYVFHISEAYSMAKNLKESNSYVVISFKINNAMKHIFLASKEYVLKDKTNAFYNAHKIGLNVNLLSIPHGTSEDYPENTMPLFIKAAEEIHQGLLAHESILVNCHHGRSRSGTVIALYLMNHLDLKVTPAIHLVTEALKQRGFPGGIDIEGAHGSYGDWLRNYKPEGNKENEATRSLHNMSLRKRPLQMESTDLFFPTGKRIKTSDRIALMPLQNN